MKLEEFSDRAGRVLDVFYASGFCADDETEDCKEATTYRSFVHHNGAISQFSVTFDYARRKPRITLRHPYGTVSQIVEEGALLYTKIRFVEMIAALT